MFAEKLVALSAGPALIVDHAFPKLPKADPIKPSQLDFNGLGSIKVGNQNMKATVSTPHSKQPGPVFPSARWFAQRDQPQAKNAAGQGWEKFEMVQLRWQR